MIPFYLSFKPSNGCTKVMITVVLLTVIAISILTCICSTHDIDYPFYREDGRPFYYHCIYYSWNGSLTMRRFITYLAPFYRSRGCTKVMVTVVLPTVIVVSVSTCICSMTTILPDYLFYREGGRPFYGCTNAPFYRSKDVHR